jgi:hypothetical protein
MILGIYVIRFGRFVEKMSVDGILFVLLRTLWIADNWQMAPHPDITLL